MSGAVYLGIEGGGTKTIAVAADRDLQIIGRSQFGPGNARLLDPAALARLFREIATHMPAPVAVGIGLAGVRTAEDRSRIESNARTIWGAIPIRVTHDLEIALRAAVPTKGGAAEILVLSGTGSCCYGESRSGESTKLGGWGHLLGDIGSGYDIALRALRSVIFEFDRKQEWTRLGNDLLQSSGLNSPEEFIGWAQSSDKAGIAQLAPTVFASAVAGDRLARSILARVAAEIAHDASTCAHRLARRSAPVRFVLAGSVLRSQKAFAQKIRRLLRSEWPNAVVDVLDREGAVGAVRLAIQEADRAPTPTRLPAQSQAASGEIYVPTFDPASSPTEQRNPKSSHLDRLSIGAALDLMLDADSEIVPALRAERRSIERGIRLASESLSKGGRILYVGAGTSGRLGVLDASECPPTFGASPNMIQGIIAGGPSALWRAVEGAEDDDRAGRTAIGCRGVNAKDTVIGIAASGRTPFVWGAFAEARKCGARTVLVCFNPSLRIDREHKPDVVIAPDLGPEVLTGSTRLKCGTATKLILNMVSTISMVRLGKVVSNLMVDLNPSNVKLRDRAIRIVCQLGNCSPAQAQSALERNHWIVKEALGALSVEKSVTNRSIKKHRVT